MRQKTIQERAHSLDRLLSVADSGILHMTYDQEADAGYIAVTRSRIGKVARTVQLKDWLLADFDKDGKLLGIEMLFVSLNLPASSVRELRAATA